MCEVFQVCDFVFVGLWPAVGESEEVLEVIELLF